MSEAAVRENVPQKASKRFFKESETLSLVVGFISNMLIVVATLCMGFALVLSLMGMRTMYVVSNSMVPTFSKGDLLVVTKEYHALAVGDIIAYKAPWAEDKNVTHRIVALDKTEVTAKGDNNATADPPAPVENIYGEIVATVPKAGLLFNPFTIVSVTVLGLILSYIADMLRPRARHALVRKGSLSLHSKKAPQTER